MKLIGDANWWIPAWLDRALPNVHPPVADGLRSDPDAGQLVTTSASRGNGSEPLLSSEPL
jgi:putative drug exporter of the RND superfamily